MNNIQRNKYLDVYKGIATLSVILFHIIIKTEINSKVFNIIVELISLYFMPLFMGVSGFLCYSKSDKYKNNMYIVRKSVKLLIPLIMWSYIVYLLKDIPFTGIISSSFLGINNIVDFSKELMLNPEYIWWFLWVLFIFNLLIFVIAKTKIKEELIFVLIEVLLLVFFFYESNDYFHLSYYWACFSFGYLLNKRNKLISKKYKIIVPIIAFLILLIGRIFQLSNYVIYSSFFRSWLLAIISISLIILFVHTVDLKITYSILGKIGNYSLEFYLVQIICSNFGIGTGYIKLATNLIFCLLICVVIIYCIKKVEVLDDLLFGNISRKISIKETI